MKILKIFGLVVAVHAAVFMFIFAIPGCRSTGKQKPAVPAGDAMSASGGNISTDAPSVVASDTGESSHVLFSPTRPGTAAAAVIESQPPADVQPVSAYTVVKGDNLWSIAKKNGTSVKELTAANNLQANSPLHLGQKLIIPGKPLTKSAASAAVAGAGAEKLSYTVKAGDTLAAIARHAGTTTAAIKSLNKLKSDVVRVGQVLTISAGGASAPVAAPAEAARPASSGAKMTHVVKAGDTLGGIARKYQVKVGDIAAANNIADPTKIRIGQTLTIPGWQAPSASAPAAAASTSAPSAPEPAPAPAVESPLVSPAADSPLVSPAPDSSAGAPVIKIEGSSSTN